MLARSMTRRALHAWLGCAVATACVAPSAASAQDRPTVVVAPFEGRGAPAMQRTVERTLEGRAEVVSDDEADRAAEQAGVSGTAPGGVSELASAVRADLVVQGSVSGSRRAPRVELVIRAADGAELARGSATRRRGRRGQRAFTRAIARVFDEAVSALASHRPPPEPVEAIEEPVEEEPAPAAPAPEDGLAIFTATAGVAVRTRDADIALEGGGTRRYASGAYPEILIALEARPFANESHLGRGLFLTAAFGHSVGLGSQTDGTMTAVSTNFLRFSGGAGWLAPIEDVAEIGVGVSVGYDGYHLGPNVVLPTAEYVYIRPAARGRVRIMKEALVIDAEVAYRGVVGMGAIAGAFGEQATTHGVDVGIGVGGNLFPVAELGFTWAVRFDWVGYFLGFAGPASDAPGVSGTESALRFSFLVGWSFR